MWHEFLPHVPKTARYSLGGKIDALFTEVLEPVFVASYLGRERKLPFLEQAGAKLDLLKFFLRVLWEVKGLDNKKYIALSERLNEIGKMLGGWRKGLEKKTPAR